MATSASPIHPPVLSQKQRKAAQRKERRKRKRQALAQLRDSDLKNGVRFDEEEDINDEDGDEITEEEKRRLHEAWLERERVAQEEFRRQAEREEAARKRKEEEEQMIREEWEAQQRKEQEEKEKRQQERRDREEAVQKRLDEAESQLENGGQWMNPEAPVTGNSGNYGTERDVANCPFFLKTGACRFGERCSRRHVFPSASPTLMIRGMFRTFGMEESRRDDYDVDACLEHSEEELQESFVEFYHDVLPELKSVGKVVQFKVSCNYEPHLRGNVYIQFDSEQQCQEAFAKFNGRWYAGRQLHCELCPVTRWKHAICGLFDRQKCPKGKHCNFLHVFRNPGNEFWEADRDMHLSPDGGVRGNRRETDRTRRQPRHSRSPGRWERRSRERRSRSRERRSRERRSRERRSRERRSYRSQHSERRRDISRSEDRDRSGGRDRERRNRSEDRERRNRSEDRTNRDHEKTGEKSRSRDRSQSRSKDREKSEERASGDGGETRENSRSRSGERRSKKRSREKSPRKSEKSKRSKKSKKKSKKKHKTKGRRSGGMCSSSESEKELKEETADKECESNRDEAEQSQERLHQDSDDEKNLSLEGKCEQSNPEVSDEPTGNGENGENSLESPTS